MATITINVTHNGSPLSGADIVLGDLTGTAVTTNESGSLTKTVNEGWAIYVPITITHDDLPEGRRDFGIFLLEAGGEYTFAL